MDTQKLIDHLRSLIAENERYAAVAEAQGDDSARGFYNGFVLAYGHILGSIEDGAYNAG